VAEVCDRQACARPASGIEGIERRVPRHDAVRAREDNAASERIVLPST